MAIETKSVDQNWTHYYQRFGPRYIVGKILDQSDVENPRLVGWHVQDNNTRSVFFVTEYATKKEIADYQIALSNVGLKHVTLTKETFNQFIEESKATLDPLFFMAAHCVNTFK